MTSRGAGLRQRLWGGLFLAACAVVAAAAEPDAALEAAIATYRTDGAETALPRFEQLLATYEQAGDRAQAATTLRYLGEAHWRLGALDDSRAWLERALEAYGTLGDRAGEGRTLNVLGLLEWDLGDYGAALAAFGDAHAIADEIGDDKLTASVLNNRGLVLDEQGDYAASLAAYRQSYALFERLDNLRGQGDALGNQGGVHLLLGDFAEALALYERALAISERLGSSPAMTIDHGNIALCLLGLGRHDEALAHFDQALALARETGMRHEEAYWQRGKANALIRRGRLDLGLELHRRALATYEETGARGLLLDALHDLGALHLSLGDTLSAEADFRRALDLGRDIGHAQAVTVNLLALGDLAARREQADEAEALYRQALARATLAGESGQQAEAELRLAAAAQQRGDWKKAGEHAEAAGALAAETGAAATEAEAWWARGEAARAGGRTDRALEAYARAAGRAGDPADPALAWRIHHGRAQALVQAGEKERAVEELLAAVRTIEGVRNRLAEDRFRAGYVQDKYEVYLALVRLQLELGRTRDAFSAAERLRARAFLAQLDQAGPVARTDQERRRETQMRERIRQLQDMLTQERELGADARRQLAVQAYSTELLRAEREYQAFLDDLGAREADEAGLDVPALGAVQARLGAGEVLVEYVVTDEDVVIFVVSREAISAATERLPRAALAARVDLVRAMLQQPDNARWRKPAAALAEILIAPATHSGLLDEAAHLYLVPHDVLNTLPFAVLPSVSRPGAVLVEDYTLSYLPAAAALVRRGDGATAERPLLALAPAEARLKHAPEEARSISRLFEPGGELLEGADATESRFKAGAKDYDVLHLATHGEFNPANPLFSALQLEPDTLNDGRLEVHEILELHLAARLVTLSACRTGLGSGWFHDIPAGDDFVGLTRAFLFAGADAVLASLWEVDDRSTVNLMEGFYRHLDSRATDFDQARALALVQREFRASKKFSHPFYWAPFVLVGQHGGSAAPG